MPAPHRRLIVATGNPGKLSEFRDLLADAPFELTSLGELGMPSPEESGATLRENAMLKARHAAANARCADPHAARVAIADDSAVLADDSGLEVDALGGAPGVHSARYAGTQGDDAANNAKLIASLRALGLRAPPPWRARYRCVLIMLRAADDPEPLIAEGCLEGVIVESPQGSNGFGYDPHFWLPQLGLTAAQLSPHQKNRISHRGAAARSLLAQL